MIYQIILHKLRINLCTKRNAICRSMPYRYNDTSISKHLQSILDLRSRISPFHLAKHEFTPHLMSHTKQCLTQQNRIDLGFIFHEIIYISLLQLTKHRVYFQITIRINVLSHSSRHTTYKQE